MNPPEAHSVGVGGSSQTGKAPEPSSCSSIYRLTGSSVTAPPLHRNSLSPTGVDPNTASATPEIPAATDRRISFEYCTSSPVIVRRATHQEVDMVRAHVPLPDDHVVFAQIMRSTSRSRNPISPRNTGYPYFVFHTMWYFRSVTVWAPRRYRARSTIRCSRSSSSP